MVVSLAGHRVVSAPLADGPPLCNASPIMSTSVLVTLANDAYVQYAKQMFGSVHKNGRWDGEYVLLTDGLSPANQQWFENRGIEVWTIPPLISEATWSTRPEKRYPSIITMKYHMFSEQFKRWQNVVFLDADTMVRRPIDRLARVNALSAYHNIALKNLFSIKRPFRDMGLQEYSPFRRCFTAGVVAFPTTLCGEETVSRLQALTEKYISSGALEEAVLNIYFYNQSRQLPSVYNVPIYRPYSNRSIRCAIILHCIKKV
jgi:lipopolysaccharide biosynthesis glycosyltransferase